MLKSKVRPGKMVNYFIFLLLLGTVVYGIKSSSIAEGNAKRSDILVHDLVKQMVAQQVERGKMLEEFRKIKNELSDVKLDLKERNSLKYDMKIFLIRKIKHMIENIEKELTTKVKKEMSRCKQRISVRTKKTLEKYKATRKNNNS